MSISNYFYSTSTQPPWEHERLMCEQRQRQLYFQAMAQQQSEMARRENPLRNGLNDVFEGQQRVAAQPQEPQKPELNKVLLLCS